MNELNGLYAMWLREFKVFQRERSRIASSIFMPLLWLGVFGVGLGSKVSIDGFEYQTFIFPGILSMATLFTSLFFGVYIVWDRRIDFLKEVMVAPLMRTTIFAGKVIGGMTDSLIQATVILIAGLFFGISYTLPSLLLSFTFILLLSIGMVSLGLTIGSFMESPEGFGMVVSFVAFPLFFLSGALFPTDDLPAWLAVLVSFDPVTYAVDGLRGVLLGVSQYSIALDLAVLSIFSSSMVIIGTKAFERMKV